ncbi:hypothetical protein NHQ30_007886 [Ciborinia camelliae]|nr:hypothetical protein NHQ30_007886 [Ciborinia camelliae]
MATTNSLEDVTDSSSEKLDELLKLFRGINSKLERENEHSSSERDDELLKLFRGLKSKLDSENEQTTAKNQQDEKDTPWRWYEHFKPASANLSFVSPEHDQESSNENRPEGDDNLHSNEKRREPRNSIWGQSYSATSSFKGDKDLITPVDDDLRRSLGSTAPPIPHDGRINLAFTSQGFCRRLFSDKYGIEYNDDDFEGRKETWLMGWIDERGGPDPVMTRAPANNLPLKIYPENYAPWRRIIMFTGLSSLPSTTEEPCPYFPELFEDSLLKKVFKQHQECSILTPENAAMNPYLDSGSFEHDCLFTITYFEELPPNIKRSSSWKTGQLFEDGNTETRGQLRHSAFTILSRIDFHYRKTHRFVPFYTILLLGSDTLKVNLGDHRKSLRQRTNVQAELYWITFGLSNAIRKWTGLNQYFEELLSVDFMDIKKYTKLLFDDETFSRSQKYFWAIGCLSEFDKVISDNIKHWKLYYEGRIKPFLELEDLEVHLDAAALHPLALLMLFNASALVESRASTRLGENVKLLTYVSIFYLPLAFCAALWAIPNIESTATKVPFVVTTIIVGAITYAIVFNMDTMTDKMKTFYSPRRDRLIEQMQKETGTWKVTGERFEEFKPTSERRVPNEWWILIYWARIICLGIVSGQNIRKGNVDDAENLGQAEQEVPEVAVPEEAPADTSQHAKTLTSRLVSRFRGRRERDAVSSV